MRALAGPSHTFSSRISLITKTNAFHSRRARLQYRFAFVRHGVCVDGRTTFLQAFLHKIATPHRRTVTRDDDGGRLGKNKKKTKTHPRKIRTARVDMARFATGTRHVELYIAAAGDFTATRRNSFGPRPRLGWVT